MNHFIENHINEISTTVKHSSYVVSSSMIASSIFDFMNNNVGVIGFFGLMATWFLNRHLGNKKLILEKKARDEDREMESNWRQKEYELKSSLMKRRDSD